MVLDVFVKGCNESFSCRYTGFSKFRCEILRGWNEELGKLYEKKYGFLWDKSGELMGWFEMLDKIKCAESNRIQEQIDKILDEYDKPYNEGMKIFARHSDCEGEITPKERELVLKSFERVDPDKFDNSNEEINEWYRESYDVWLKMLKYTVENNKSIIFG